MESREKAFFDALLYDFNGGDVANEISNYVPVEVGGYKVPNTCLQSPFDALDTTGTECENKNLYFAPKPVSISKEDFFPTTESKATDAQKQFDELKNKLNNINDPDFFVRSFRSHFLLQKYASNLPGSKPFISLYEQSRLRAAFALALHDYNEYEPAAESKKSEHPFLLLGVEISGIQKYIYNISSSKASKSLKGRSFYVNSLMMGLALRFLRLLDLSWSNVLYISGGKFFIITPNTEEIKSTIDTERRNILKEFWASYADRLYVNIEYIGFKIVDKKHYTDVPNKKNKDNNSFSDIWDAIFDKLGAGKFKKWQPLMNNPDFLKMLFEPSNDVDPNNRCEVTGIAVKGNLVKLEANDEDDAEGPIMVSEVVYKQIEMGKMLSKANEHTYIEKYNDDFNLAGTEQGIYIEHNKSKEFLTLAKKQVPFNVNFEGNNPIDLYYWYGGNRTPQVSFVEDNTKNKKYRPATFDELAGYDALGNEIPFKRLGVLRMDVDGLGYIFQKGLKGDNASFAVYSSLSNRLDMFFAGYLNTIRNEGENQAEDENQTEVNFADYISIIYSGGDDVFAVGRWDKTIDFAERIKKDFKDYVGSRSCKVSISGGLAFVTHKFPIAVSAQQAGEAEDDAKKHRRKDKDGVKDETKNSITLLGMPLKWDDEYIWVKDTKNKLLNWINLGVSEALFTDIQQLAAHHKFKKDKGITDYSHIWMLAYRLSRIQIKGERVDRKELKQLQTEVFTARPNELQYSKYETIELLGLAARWAEMEHRTKPIVK